MADHNDNSNKDQQSFNIEVAMTITQTAAPSPLQCECSYCASSSALEIKTNTRHWYLYIRRLAHNYPCDYAPTLPNLHAAHKRQIVLSSLKCMATFRGGGLKEKGGSRFSRPVALGKCSPQPTHLGTQVCGSAPATALCAGPQGRGEQQ